MKRAFLVLIASGLLMGLIGCAGPKCGTCKSAPETCATCPCRHGAADAQPGSCACGAATGTNGTGLLCPGGHEAQPSGPPTGGVTYPYYTVRGPRDYFANNPPSIGP
jgi:hypothetical protein